MPFYENDMKRNNADWLPFDDFWKAYVDCKKCKRHTRSCAEFEFNEVSNLYGLWRDLNNHTYEIGNSIAFAVTRPKLREIFAADFRDRIVHHLIILKTLPLFEARFIDDSYNCRKGKGTLFGINKIYEKIESKGDCWVLKLDLQGFFMSIDKELLRDKLKDFIYSNYKGSDIEHLWWLTEMVVMHRPEMKCTIQGDKELLASIPEGKTLLKGDGTKGLAIGNLTSQIFANFFLVELDEYLSSIDGIGYGRYVDDFILVGEKAILLNVFSGLRQWLLNNLKVKLHPKKMYLQHCSKGVSFVGTVIKRGRTYICNRTINHCKEVIDFYNGIKHPEDEIERFAQRYNSYMGFMVHHKTYAIRWRLWNAISDDLKKYLYITGDMRTLKVRKKYKLKYKLLEQYGSKRYLRKRKLLHEQKGIWYVGRSSKTTRLGRQSD